MLNKRTAIVNRMDVTAVASSAVFNIGDTNVSRPTAKAIAVQKEGSVYTPETEKNFEDYSLFKQKAVWPKYKGVVHKQTFQHCDTIEVNHVKIIGIAQSANLNVGNLDEIHAESRLKHFREYLPNTSGTPTT